jgi:hypothetical protein
VAAQALVRVVVNSLINQAAQAHTQEKLLL